MGNSAQNNTTARSDDVELAVQARRALTEFVRFLWLVRKPRGGELRNKFMDLVEFGVCDEITSNFTGLHQSDEAILESVTAVIAGELKTASLTLAFAEHPTDDVFIVFKTT